MAFSNWNTVGSLVTPAVEKEDFLPSKRSVMVATKIKTAFVPLQVKCEKRHKSLTTKCFAVSRRDMMQCLTAEVLGLALLPKPAIARVSRLEMRKKIMEKLEELREKAGLSKPKTENEMKSPTKPSPKDKKSPTLPLPPPESAVQLLVEVTLSNIPPSNNAL
ncbi:PREDICTED: uncharacterized protein LOC108660955 [Theobroma cacao]|uniref:Uncharacterized protein LOC108660955 n=1 Tax=Theobroma cacao TaxID=3641 RepID=A0AB32VZT3_THECC|nr:PREDICTED: uncharacterized protein LOC108660955 [Theobroma cacao]